MDTTHLDPLAFRRHARLNRLQSLVLIGALAGYLALLGWLLWGALGALWMLGAGAILVAINPQISPQLVLGLYQARPLYPQEVPDLHRAIAILAMRAGLAPPPALYYVPSALLNAFAVGQRGRAVIALTDGLLRAMTWRELVGVLAHEVSHLQANDLWVMGIADLFSRLTHLLSLFGQVLLLVNLPLALFAGYGIDWIAIGLLLLAPHLAVLTQLALSRTREYDADLNAAALTGDPRGLASALARLESRSASWLTRVLLPGRGEPEPSVLRTHPLTAERIRRLLSLEQPVEPVRTLFVEPESLIYPNHWPRPRRPGWRITGVWH